jgi:hypothetical protein
MKVIINQPFGVGDILFLNPLVNSLDIEEAIWPVVDHYYWVGEYFKSPHIKFIKQSEFNQNNYLDYTVIPFQYAHSIMSDAEDCMIAKYKMMGANIELWRTLSFTRNKEKEDQLKKYLGIFPQSKFVLINNNFAGPEYNYKTNINLETNLNLVYLDYIKGFTLLDWCGVLEQAEEIHTVSTSLFFVIEALNLKNTSLHLYPRKPLDQDLSPIRTLISNKWICHE